MLAEENSGFNYATEKWNWLLCNRSIVGRRGVQEHIFYGWHICYRSIRPWGQPYGGRLFACNSCLCTWILAFSKTKTLAVHFFSLLQEIMIPFMKSLGEQTASWCCADNLILNREQLTMGTDGNGLRTPPKYFCLCFEINFVWRFMST